MKLVVFDIDGTLTLMDGLGTRCFIGALRALHGIDDIVTDWSHYRHSTDRGITAELLERHFGREPHDDEIHAVRGRYIEELTVALAPASPPIRRVAGAREAIENLLASGEWLVAIATGGWRDLQLMKLERAGYDAAHLPGAFAEDSLSRAGIIHAARNKAQAAHGIERFERVVYVGDGVWDARSCRETGVAFVGVNTHRRREALLREGASHVIDDYTDFRQVLEALNHAASPSVPSIERTPPNRSGVGKNGD